MTLTANHRDVLSGSQRCADAHTLSANPLHTRDDMQRAIVDLCTPLETKRSDGGARIRIHGPRASYTDACQGMEGFARMLWGVAPLIAGGGVYGGTGRICEGLVNGCDPNHPEYWGAIGDRDQRIVEAAAIAFAILLAPQAFWTPLSSRQRRTVAAYLATINKREVRDNNWRFFRVLVNLMLARCDGPFSAYQLTADLDRIDSFYLGDGWYADGCNRAVDYYSAFGMHFYGLVCASVMHAVHDVRARAFGERAAAFSRDFIHWFSANGAAIPYGRSLTYRWAQAAFWSALALAHVDAAPWGVIKGLVLRHLRWWFRQPVLTDGGLLSIGYAYPNQLVADRYSSPCSPYWALKAFLPVAVASDAAFWRADEQELPELEASVAQPRSGMIVCRDRGHVFALAAAARVPPRLRHVPATYGKFCYSTCFGFSLPSSYETLQAGAHDSALALSENGDGLYRTRRESYAVEMSSARIVSHWTAWPDVVVATWLIPMPPWHVRVHRVRTGRPLLAAEGGFAVALGSNEADWRDWSHSSGRCVCARTEQGLSAIVDLLDGRRGETIRADPNTNVLFPRTVIPTLHAVLPPGEHWLACAVVAISATDAPEDVLGPPACTLTPHAFEIHDHRGRLVLREPHGSVPA